MICSMANYQNDAELLAALRQGDEDAFADLLERYHNALLRVALIYVSDSGAAEEVVQETWMGVLRGLDRFEGRSSLKTWIFSILSNNAKTRGQREKRYEQTASLDEPAVEGDRFYPVGHEWAHYWVAYPADWEALPEGKLLAQETIQQVQQAIATLPTQQREVITLRDVEGWSAEETCQCLNLSENNQRVLLHRARAKVRRALESYLEA
jgi:RNA polymerase sigma-70 factor (ECF subfamily)